MTDLSVDPICRGIEREPLAHYDHSDAGVRSIACTVGEDPAIDCTHPPSCRGCLTRAAALFVVKEPHSGWLDGDLSPTTPLAWFRKYTDEFDPLRVTVERELVRRGIA